MRKLFTLALVFAVLCLFSAPAWSDSTLASSYQIVRKSLALVAYTEGKTLITGSAFCVGNDDGFSLFLTNAHVVGDQKRVAVFVAGEKSKPYIGLVIRVNLDLDLAVLAIKDSIPPLHLGRDRLGEGEGIGIAGYPSSNIDFAFAGLGLSPAVHAGTLNSYEAEGRLMVFDAQVEHGNSGGPIFDPGTGIVYGVVVAKYGSDQTNLGEPIDVTFPFLENAGVPIIGITRSEVLANVESPKAEAAEPTVSSANAYFKTYIPLTYRDQHYKCTGNVTADMTIRPSADLNGDALVTTIFHGLAASPVLSLQRHDADGDLLMVGYVDGNGSIHAYSTHPVAIPLTPFDGFTTLLPEKDGGAYQRAWTGNTVIKLPMGTYEAQVYQDRLTNGTFSSAYADQIGLVGMLYQNNSGKAIFGCSLEKIITD